MPTDEVVLMSTSDSEADVRRALKLPDEKPAEPAPAATPPVTPAAAAPTTPDAGAPAKVEAKDAKGGSPKAEERIATLTKERYDAQARIEQLEKELKAKSEPAAPADGSAPPATPGEKTFDEPRPKQDDFSDFDKYLEAREEWADKRAQFNAAKEVQTALEAQRRAAWEEDQKRIQQAALANWYKRVDEARTQYPDYEEAMKAEHLNVDPKVIPGIRDYAFNEATGTVLGYYLAKSPAEFDRIARLPYGAQIAECAKIDAKLQAGLIQMPTGTVPTPDAPAAPGSAPVAPPAAARPPVSAAPLPPPRVGGGGGGAQPASLDKIAQSNDYQAFKNARNNASRVGGGRPH